MSVYFCSFFVQVKLEEDLPAEEFLRGDARVKCGPVLVSPLNVRFFGSIPDMGCAFKVPNLQNKPPM